MTRDKWVVEAFAKTSPLTRAFDTPGEAETYMSSLPPGTIARIIQAAEVLNEAAQLFVGCPGCKGLHAGVVGIIRDDPPKRICVDCLRREGLLFEEDRSAPKGKGYFFIDRPAERDWTKDADGRSNSSEKFNECVALVERLILGSGHDLIAGQAKTVAILIVAQLAHGKGLAPR